MKKRKDGYYKATKTVRGKQICFYGKTRAEAYKKREEFTEKVESPLFKDIAEEWWEQTDYAYNSYKCYKPAYLRAVEEYGDMFVTDITPSILSKYIRDFSNKGYADKTVRTQLSVFNMIFKYAINFCGLETNPARDIQIPKGLMKKKVTMPSDEDIKKVKESVTLPFGLFPFMAMYTGMRRGELLALTSADIDKDYITVSKSLYHENNHPMVKKPKTESGVRRIPILDQLRPYLKKKKILFSVDGGYMTEVQFQKAWGDYVKATGISCTPHQLRHCFATMLYEANVSSKDAQYLLGHAQLSTTMDIYTDIRKTREADIAEKVKSIDIRV